MKRKLDDTSTKHLSLRRNVQGNDSANKENVVSFIAAIIAKNFSMQCEFIHFQGRKIH